MLDSKVIIALGYFDSVHIGHQKVLSVAKAFAKEEGARVVVFTFDGNLKKALFSKNDGCVFLAEERKSILKELGFNDVFFAPTTNEFLEKDKKDFLDYINSIYAIRGYVCGNDYRFGKKGLGDVNFLKEYANTRSQSVIECETLFYEGEKVSSTSIKELLQQGNINKVNCLLGREYSITARVVHGRRVGNKIGFPTINLEDNLDRFRLKEGVYYGKVVIDGKRYKAVINYGKKPTFNQFDSGIEAHLIDFDGNLYDKNITLYFTGYLRDIFKFESVDKLISQLKYDVNDIREKNYD